MPHVTFTRHLLRFFPTLTEGEVPGTTVREVIDELDKRYPGFAGYIIDELGRLRRHVNVFLGEEPICDRETLSDKLSPSDKLFILQALSGG
jgi:hypothetical protein